MRNQIAEAAARHVHAVDLPVGRLEDALGQVVPDEAVDTEDEDLFHGATPKAIGQSAVRRNVYYKMSIVKTKIEAR